MVPKELPQGIKRLFLRSPILLYKIGLAPLLGKRFLKLTHTGRKSGLVRETVLEVVKHDCKTGTYYIASGWGAKSNWLLNILKLPRVGVQVGNRKFSATANHLSADEAVKILLDYAGHHPAAFSALARFALGETLDKVSPENVRRFAEHVPVIALEPVRTERPRSAEFYRVQIDI